MNGIDKSLGQRTFVSRSSGRLAVEGTLFPLLGFELSGEKTDESGSDVFSDDAPIFSSKSRVVLTPFPAHGPVSSLFRSADDVCYTPRATPFQRGGTRFHLSLRNLSLIHI